MKIFPNLQGPNRTLAQTVSVVVVMGALAWASVPFMTGSAVSLALVASPMWPSMNRMLFWIRPLRSGLMPLSTAICRGRLSLRSVK